MPQATTLNKSELKIILAVIAQGRHQERNRIMFLLSHWAGMRVGEIASLRIGDIVNSNGVVKSEIKLNSDQTKGNRGRSVFISDRLNKELSQYLSFLESNDFSSPLIYSQKTRAGFTANSLAQQFKTIYQRAAFDTASSHSGRRSFITNLASKGVGVRVLMSLAGHQNINTTQIYIDFNDDMKRKAVNLL